MLRKKVIPGGDPKEPIIRIIAVSWANDREIGKQMLKLMETCPSLDKAYKTIMAQECTLAQVFLFSFLRQTYIQSSPWISVGI
jgi:hypothetical protein